MLNSSHQRQPGFGLLEILVAVFVLGTILVGLMMALSYAIKSNNQAQIRVTARDLAQEGVDFFRTERQALGYAAFSEVVGSGESTYCLDDLPTSVSIDRNNNVIDDLTESICSSYSIEVDGVSADLKREAVLTKQSDYYDVKVTVSWENDQGSDSQVTAQGRLYRW
jgi:Tfp pilus assembly protein PilV